MRHRRRRSRGTSKTSCVTSRQPFRQASRFEWRSERRGDGGTQRRGLESAMTRGSLATRKCPSAFAIARLAMPSRRVSVESSPTFSRAGISTFATTCFTQTLPRSNVLQPLAFLPISTHSWQLTFREGCNRMDWIGFAALILSALLWLLNPAPLRRRLGLEARPAPPPHFTAGTDIAILRRDPVVAVVIPSDPDRRLAWEHADVIATAKAKGMRPLLTPDGAGIRHGRVVGPGKVTELVLMVRAAPQASSPGCQPVVALDEKLHTRKGRHRG